MKELIKRVQDRFICEEKSTPMGSFGGKRYFWPDVGSKWDAIDWDFEAGANSNALSIKYQYFSPSFVFVEFNARNWLQSDGKKPILYYVTWTGKKVDSGKIRNPSDVVGVLKTAAKAAVDFMAKAKQAMPSVKGWKKIPSKDVGIGEVRYTKRIGGADAEVTFQGVEDVFNSNGPGDLVVMPRFALRKDEWMSMKEVVPVLLKVEKAVEKSGY